MTQKQVVNQMMEFNQAAFDNTFNAITLLQEQAERMLHLSLEQTTMLPKDGKRVFTDWLKAWTKGSETFKKAVDDGFQKMEGFLT